MNKTYWEIETKLFHDKEWKQQKIKYSSKEDAMKIVKLIFKRYSPVEIFIRLIKYSVEVENVMIDNINKQLEQQYKEKRKW